MNNLDNRNMPSDDSNSELLELQAAIDAQTKKESAVLEIKSKIIDLIEQHIHPYKLNEEDVKVVTAIIATTPVKLIVESIFEAAEKKLVIIGGRATRESVDIFMDALPRFANVKRMTPIDQKVSYIKGICKNRFIAYWDAENGGRVINGYIDVLRNSGWSDDEILVELDTNVIPMTAKMNYWQPWRETFDSWSDEIRGKDNE